MDDLRIPLQRPAPAPGVTPRDGATTEAAESGWWRVLAVSFSRGALALVLGLLVWSVLPMVVGWTPRAIMSGSMEPRIHVGDVVVGRPVDPSTLVTGQVVTVVDPDHPAKTRTHRLLRRDTHGHLILKGDANPQADSTPVLPSKVLGLGAVRVPYVARPVYWLAEGAYLPLGLTLLALVAVGLTAAAPLRLPPAAPSPPTGPPELDGPGADRDDRDDHDASGGSRGPGPGVVRPSPVRGSRSPARPLVVSPARVVRAVAVPRRRWAVFTAVIASAAVLSPVMAAPTQAAYGVTTGTATNTWAAAASFTSYVNAVAADAPLLHWRLDSTSGTTAVDTQAGSHPGTVSGSYTWGRPGALVGEPTSKALGLTSGLVVANTATSSLTAKFTVEAWVRSTSTTGGLVVGLANALTSTQDDRLLYLGPDGRVRFGVGATTKAAVASMNPVNDGRWHHVVGVVDGTSSNMATLYVDGAAQGATITASATLLAGYWRAGTETLVGWPGNPTTSALTGDIDEVAVYNAALTAARVKAHYNAGVTP